METIIIGSTLTIDALAQALGKQKIERELPDGRKVIQLVWEGSDLHLIADLLHNRSAELPQVVDIDGPAPAWLVTALAHEVHPSYARLNSPDGFVPVGCGGNPAGDGEGIAWTKTEIGTVGNGRKLVKVEFQIDPSRPFNKEDLLKVIPPAVGLSDVVVLSGRGPNWLVASIAMAYHGRSAACAPFQPGTGSTVAWTHVADVPLGDIITI